MTAEQRESNKLDVARPGLCAAGELAFQTVLAVATEDGDTYTGGCKAFYTPAEWKLRGELFSEGAVLIVCHDGGCFAPYFNHSYGQGAASSKMYERLAQVGLWPEPGACWFTFIHKD